jgi:hypothetical protein
MRRREFISLLGGAAEGGRSEAGPADMSFDLLISPLGWVRRHDLILSACLERCASLRV